MLEFSVRNVKQDFEKKLSDCEYWFTVSQQCSHEAVKWRESSNPACLSLHLNLHSECVKTARDSANEDVLSKLLPS